MALNRTKDKYYPSFRKDVPLDVQYEARLVRDALYSLQDRSFLITELTLTASTIIDVELTEGKPMRFILNQDSIGGWSVTWTTKFRGVNLLTLTTTANTYSIIDFEVLAINKALLSNFITGGNL